MTRTHRAIHAWLWHAFAIVLPVVLLTALTLRQNAYIERPAEQIAPPSEQDQ